MQNLVGIIRTEAELQKALDELARAQGARWRASRVAGQPPVQPRLAPRARPPAMLIGRPRRSHARAIERKESRGGHTRDDFPATDAAVRQGERACTPARRTASSTVAQEPLPEMPDELKALLEEESRWPIGRRDARSRCGSGAATPTGGAFEEYQRRRPRRAWSSSTSIHHIQATQAPDLAVRWNCKAGQVRLVQRRDQRQAAADVHDAHEHLRRRARRSRSRR